MKVMTNSTMNHVVFTFTKPNRPVYTSTISTDEIAPARNCHGRKRPHLVVVLSMMLPSSGSMKISAIRITTTKPVMTPISLVATPLSTPANKELVT